MSSTREAAGQRTKGMEERERERRWLLCERLREKKNRMKKKPRDENGTRMWDTRKQ